MINQFLLVGVGIPVLYVLFNLIIFFIFKGLRMPVARPFKEITGDWLGFMKKGIPIPADYKRIETPYSGKPVLTQPIFQIKRDLAEAQKVNQ